MKRPRLENYQLLEGFMCSKVVSSKELPFLRLFDINMRTTMIEIAKRYVFKALTTFY
jgi:hypothetical protein